MSIWQKKHSISIICVLPILVTDKKTKIDGFLVFFLIKQ